MQFWFLQTLKTRVELPIVAYRRLNAFVQRLSNFLPLHHSLLWRKFGLQPVRIVIMLHEFENWSHRAVLGCHFIKQTLLNQSLSISPTPDDLIGPTLSEKHDLTLTRKITAKLAIDFNFSKYLLLTRCPFHGEYREQGVAWRVVESFVNWTVSTSRVRRNCRKPQRSECYSRKESILERKKEWASFTSTRN